jgi:elongation factor 2
LTGEPLRGVRFDVRDAKLHQDAPHRGSRQIDPATKQVIAAALLAAKPQLLEPMYLCTVNVPRVHLAGVYSTLRSRRSTIKPGEGKDAGDMCRVEAYLPVSESFGFSTLLRKNTSGQAFAEMIFDHWNAVPGDIFEEGSMANVTALKIRQRKKMNAQLPQLSDYNEKL